MQSARQRPAQMKIESPARDAPSEDFRSRRARRRAWRADPPIDTGRQQKARRRTAGEIADFPVECPARWLAADPRGKFIAENCEVDQMFEPSFDCPEDMRRNSVHRSIDRRISLGEGSVDRPLWSSANQRACNSARGGIAPKAGRRKPMKPRLGPASGLNVFRNRGAAASASSRNGIRVSKPVQKMTRSGVNSEQSAKNTRVPFEAADRPDLPHLPSAKARTNSSDLVPNCSLSVPPDILRSSGCTFVYGHCCAFQRDSVPEKGKNSQKNRNTCWMNYRQTQTAEKTAIDCAFVVVRRIASLKNPVGSAVLKA